MFAVVMRELLQLLENPWQTLLLFFSKLGLNWTSHQTATIYAYYKFNLIKHLKFSNFVAHLSVGLCCVEMTQNLRAPTCVWALANITGWWWWWWWWLLLSSYRWWQETRSNTVVSLKCLLFNWFKCHLFSPAHLAFIFASCAALC